MLYWPALGIGLVVTAYWFRVLQLVRKMKRRTGRDAHFVPPEKLGRALRVVWYPTVFAWIVLPYLSFLRPAYPTWNALLFSHAAITIPAVAVALAALVATMVCWKKMGRSWRMGIDPTEKTSLVVTGPFAYVRHPIYALSSLLMVSSIVAVCTPLMIVVGVIHIGFLQWEARREERHLVRLHGRDYVNYMARTSRFVPIPGVSYHSASQSA
jgi:protein-S-isoprenylcysteine O-methyltransferase Ste14